MFWIVNEIRMVLECSDFYSPTPDRFPDFQTVSRARHFAFGQGLPGSAWQSRTVVHYPELSLAQNFPRLSVAASEHLRTGVAFPLYVGKRVLGIIEMFNAEPRDLAPATQEFLVALGGQIGVFLERFYAGRTLQAADAQFVLLAEAASLAIFTIDDQSNILFANPAVEKVFWPQGRGVDWWEADGGDA